MDPNETLRMLRVVTERALTDEFHDKDDIVEVAELFEALDQWLSKGGFLPDAWKR